MSAPSLAGRQGAEVTWRARHFGVWQVLTSKITAFERPHHFSDSQVRGAFARFDHDHYFDAINGGTLLRDVFDYRAPFGPFGWAAERLFVSAYMRRFLLARLREIKAMAESDSWRRFCSRQIIVGARCNGGTTGDKRRWLPSLRSSRLRQRRNRRCTHQTRTRLSRVCAVTA